MSSKATAIEVLYKPVNVEVGTKGTEARKR